MPCEMSTENASSFQPARGTRDFLPEELNVRNKIVEILAKTIEKYGFLPVDTPVFENFSFLSKKSGPEVKEQIYYFKDKGDRELGLRFDLTVPIVRVVLNNPQIAKPLKLYSVNKVWRYEEISPGRYREFAQADIEILGSSETIVDAETIAVAVGILRVFGIPKIKVKINNRDILEGFAKSVGILEGKKDAFFRAVDKKEKLSEDAFRKELLSSGVPEDSIGRVIEYCSFSGDFSKVLKLAETKLNQNSLVTEGLGKLRELFSLLRNYSVDQFCELDLSIARGLDYYTGIIFEIKAGNYGLSVVGGGRYDRLLGQYSGAEMPATGFGLGIDRLYEVLEQEGKLPKGDAGSRALVIPIGETALAKAIEIVSSIRSAGINSEIDLLKRSVGKNLEFADKAKIKFGVIVGEKEIAGGFATVKNLETGEMGPVLFSQVPFFISGKLNSPEPEDPSSKVPEEGDE